MAYVAHELSHPIIYCYELSTCMHMPVTELVQIVPSLSSDVEKNETLEKKSSRLHE